MGYILIGMKLLPRPRGSDRTRDPDRIRERLLAAGFHEIHRQGFQPASLEAIVDSCRCDEGRALSSLRHGSRRSGTPWWMRSSATLLQRRWIVSDRGRRRPCGRTRLAGAPGCPDRERRTRAALSTISPRRCRASTGASRSESTVVYHRWEAGVAAALQRGQAQGSVRRDVDLAPVATFVVSSIEGALGLAKTRKRPSRSGPARRSSLATCRRCACPSTRRRTPSHWRSRLPISALAYPSALVHTDWYGRKSESDGDRRGRDWLSAPSRRVPRSSTSHGGPSHAGPGGWDHRATERSSASPAMVRPE